MTPAFERFAAMLQLAHKMLETASAENLQECCRILALNVAHYRWKYGELPLTESLELLTNRIVDDEKAEWLADAMEQVIAVLKMLQAQGSEH